VTVTVPVTGVKFAQESLSLKTGGDPAANAATVEPADATDKGVSYKSSDESVATVDASGNVTAVGVGTTIINVTTSDGSKTATCTVVVDPGEIVVNGLDGLKAALDKLPDGKPYEKILLKTDAAKVVLDGIEGVNETTLEIDAPNASVDNFAKWKEVIVENIAPDTYTEHSDNFICMRPADGHLIVAPEGKVEILKVDPSMRNLHIENNGIIANMTVNTDGTVQITGTNTNSIPVKVEAAVTLKTNLPLNMNITVEKKVTLVLQPGSEGTTVAKYANVPNPAVFGLGFINQTVFDGAVVVDKVTLVASYDEEVAKQVENVTLKGNVTAEGNPVSDAKVYLFNYTDDFDIAKYASTATAKPVAKTDANGDYSFADIKAGNYILVVQKDGYQLAQQAVYLNNTAGEAFAPAITLTKADVVVNGKIAGTVIDSAQSGDVGIKGITVRVRSGAGNLTGEVLATAETGEDGSFTFDEEFPDGFPAGVYTVEGVDLRNVDASYLSGSTTVTVAAGETANASFGMTLAVGQGELRFILHWNDEASGAPSDLDSHLLGPADDGGLFHVFYSDMSYGDAVDLDRDDTDWVGPETTTIRKKADGTYSFFIHDYTNKSKYYSNALSKSGAYVEVYSGATRLQTFYVPTNTEGTVWYVCTYDPATNTITPVNTMGYEEDEDNVGVDATYGDLRITSLEKNDFVKDYSIFGSKVVLRTSSDVSDFDVSKVKPTLADSDATYEVLYDEEEGERSIVLKKGDKTRTYSIAFAKYYGDLKVTALEKNDVIVDYTIAESLSDSMDRIEVTAKKTDYDSIKAALKPVIAQTGASFTVEEDEDATANLIITSADGSLSRTYEVYVTKDWGDLKLVSIRSNNEEIVSSVDFYGNEIEVYSTKTDFGLQDCKDYLDVTCAEGVTSEFIFSDEDVESGEEGSLRLRLTGADGETRDYFIYTYRDWGDLCIDSVSAKDASVSNVDWGGASIEVRGTTAPTVDNFFNLLEVTYGADVKTDAVKVIEEDDSLYLVLTNEAGDERRYYVEFYRDWGGLYIDSASSKDDRITYVDYDSGWLDLRGTVALTAENFDSLVDVTFGPDVTSHEFVYDEDTEQYSLVLKNAAGDERKCAVSYTRDASNDFGILDAAPKGEGITKVTLGDDWIDVYGTLDGITAENFDDMVELTFGPDVVSHDVIDDDGEFYLSLKNADGDTTSYAIHYYYDYGDLRIESASAKNDAITFVDYGDNWIEVQGTIESLTVDNFADMVEVVPGADVESFAAVDGEDHGLCLKLTGKDGLERFCDISYSYDWGDLCIESIDAKDAGITDFSLGEDWFTVWGTVDLTLDNLEDYVDITYGKDVVSHDFVEGDGGWFLVLKGEGNKERSYYIEHYRDWGDLYIDGISYADGLPIAYCDWSSGTSGDGWIELELSDSSDVQGVLDALQFQYGADTVSGTWSKVDGTYYYTIVDSKNPGVERAYRLDLTADEPSDDVSLYSVNSEEYWVCSDVSDDSVLIACDVESFDVIKDSLTFDYSSDAESCELVYSEDDSEWQVVLTGPNGYKKVYSVVFSNKDIRFAEAMGDFYTNYDGDGTYFVVRDGKLDISECCLALMGADEESGEEVTKYELVKDQDYTVELAYYDDDEGGFITVPFDEVVLGKEYTLFFRGAGEFTGGFSWDGTAHEPLDIANGVFESDATEFAVGEEPWANVTYNKVMLSDLGRFPNYKVSFETADGAAVDDITSAPAGEYVMVVTGVGVFTGELTRNITLVGDGDEGDEPAADPINFDECAAYIDSECVAGSVPYYGFEYQGEALEEGVDYTVAFQDDGGGNVPDITAATPGTYQIVCTGIGRFAGEQIASFQLIEGTGADAVTTVPNEDEPDDSASDDGNGEGEGGSTEG